MRNPIPPLYHKDRIFCAKILPVWVISIICDKRSQNYYQSNKVIIRVTNRSFMSSPCWSVICIVLPKHNQFFENRLSYKSIENIPWGTKLIHSRKHWDWVICKKNAFLISKLLIEKYSLFFENILIFS